MAHGRGLCGTAVWREPCGGTRGVCVLWRVVPRGVVWCRVVSRAAGTRTRLGFLIVHYIWRPAPRRPYTLNGSYLVFNKRNCDSKVSVSRYPPFNQRNVSPLVSL